MHGGIGAASGRVVRGGMAIGIPHQLAGTGIHGYALGLAATRLAEYAIAVLGLVGLLICRGAVAILVGIAVPALGGAVIVVIVVAIALVGVIVVPLVLAERELALDIV